MPGLASTSTACPSIGLGPLVSRSPVQAKVNMAQLLSTAESRHWQHSSAAFHAWLVHTLLLHGEMRSLPGRLARPGESSPPHKPNNATNAKTVSTPCIHFTSTHQGDVEPARRSKLVHVFSPSTLNDICTDALQWYIMPVRPDIWHFPNHKQKF